MSRISILHKVNLVTMRTLTKIVRGNTYLFCALNVSLDTCSFLEELAAAQVKCFFLTVTASTKRRQFDIPPEMIVYSLSLLSMRVCLHN